MKLDQIHTHAYNQTVESSLLVTYKYIYTIRMFTNSRVLIKERVQKRKHKYFPNRIDSRKITFIWKVL